MFSHISDDPQNDLTTFGYGLTMQVEIYLNLFFFWLFA
jgi:hypothetical protein